MALSAVLATILGGLIVVQPRIAIGVAGVAAVAVLAFVAPVANLVLIVFTTAVVPYSVQNAIGGGSGSAILSDLMIVGALGRTALVFGRVHLTQAQRRSLVVISAFLLVSMVQFVRGLMAGHAVGTAGVEFRTLFALCVFVIALPVLADERQRRRLVAGLIVPGIALGVWGLTQWTFGIGFEGEFGVREGMGGAPGGQLQGGLYGFPVAAVLAFAALNSRQVTSRWACVGLLATLVLNLASLLLTYERTFWVGTALAVAFVVVKAGDRSRAFALAWTPLLVLFAIGLLLTPSPRVLVAARERLYSLGDYQSDNSFRYRVLESRQVVDEIEQSPLTGDGLGATIVYARPTDQVATRAYHYTHNGYLWLSWKMGTPVAMLLCGLIGVAIVHGRRQRPDQRPDPLQLGSQACLLSLILVNVTFPSFNTYGITAVMGLLLAVCFAPPLPLDRSLGTLTTDLQVSPNLRVHAARAPPARLRNPAATTPAGQRVADPRPPPADGPDHVVRHDPRHHRPSSRQPGRAHPP
ncbi:MAG: O-antigen ligase family protein [Acidimicrobiales bacterium]